MAVKKKIDRMTQAVAEARKTRQQEIYDILRETFPHGHPDFLPTVIEELRLHSDKNHDYASGGDPLGNFDRVSKILSMYPNFPYASPAGVALIYALKQFDAFMWGLAQNIEHKVEGLHGRFQDVSVYMKLADIMTRNKPA